MLNRLEADRVGCVHMMCYVIVHSHPNMFHGHGISDMGHCKGV
jgi:hypothetical protein